MSNDYTVETIEINPAVRVRIVPDEDPQSPTDWDNVGEIAYSSTRYVLGTEDVTQDRLREIDAGIKDGSLIGLPVSAYIHSGVTIWVGAETSPFDQAGWDSGQSGFVYCALEKAALECGTLAERRRAKAHHLRSLSKATVHKALDCLRGEVETFDQYLRGDVYGFIVEQREPDDEDWDRAEHVDSCWGFYGLEYATEEGRAAGKHYADKLAEREAGEATEEAAREQQRERDIDAMYAGL